MRITKYLTVFVASAAVLSSCNDLEQPPINQYTDANFWTPERAEYMVNTAYSQMYSAGKMIQDECLGDNLCDTRGTEDTYRIRKGTALPTTSIFSNEWSNCYQGIKSCNIFLENVENQDIEESKKEGLKAQVRFIRAYLFFRMSNFYGDIPFFTHDLTLEEANVIARTPRAEVIQFIHDEMADIISILPTNQEETTGRITKGAAAMLDARAYLYDSEWNKVEAICRNFMDGVYGTYKLHPSYKELFSEAAEYTQAYNEEVILSRSYVQKVLTWGESMQDWLPYSIGSRTPDILPLQGLVDNYLTVGGFTIDEAGTDFKADAPYNNRDPRMTHTIFYDGYDLKAELPSYLSGNYFKAERLVFAGGPYKTKYPEAVISDTNDPGSNGYNRSGYGIRKWFSPQAPLDWNSGMNIIMMRYADVLLMYAEAMVEQNKMTAAVWDATIRPIRERAGFKVSKALNYPSSGDLREIVRNERRVELALEGLRYYDIKRWKAAGKYLNGAVAGASFVGWSDTYKFNEGRDYLWPVPENQYNLNKNLGQNPGWTTSE